MTEFLVLLLMQVTFFSSVTALILIAVKQIFKCRIPPLIGTMLWVVLLARLICPIFPESSVSVYNFIPIGRNIMFTLAFDVGERLEEQEEAFAERDNPYVLSGLPTKEEEVEVEHTPTEGSGVQSIGEYLTDAISDEETGSVAYTRSTEYINAAILIVYVLGIIIGLTCHISTYVRAKRNALATSVPCDDEHLLEICRDAAVAAGVPDECVPEVRVGFSSMVIGCMRPCIICRDGMEEREAWMMFAHELIHYKHHDNALLLFSTVIACLYWYNPLIWIVRAMLREDVELLCDSRTLEKCGIVSTDYAMMLCRNSVFGELASSAGCGMSASGRHLKTRLRTISLRKRRGLLSKVTTFALCAALILLCLTNPVVSLDSEYTAYIENYAELTGGDKREMHLRSDVTVSEYLEQLETLLADRADESILRQVGGNLERFKRLCAAEETLSEDVKQELRRLKTDEPLTNKSCALISEGMIKLLSGGTVLDEGELLLLPNVITVAELGTLTSGLTESERNALLSCYNRGVRGADVKFERVYTSAMMELILSRINDEWQRMKVSGFYQLIETEQLTEHALSDEVMSALSAVGDGSEFYMLDPNATNTEKRHLRDILLAATAGEDENVYYLKEAEDGCDAELAAFLFYRGGYTHEDMLCGYAELGECGTSMAVDAVAYTMLHDPEEVTLRGSGGAGVREAVSDCYSLGILHSDMGTIELGERLTLGEGLATAYRLVYFAVALDLDGARGD